MADRPSFLGQTRFHLIYLLFAITGVLALRDFWESKAAVDTLPYSEFRALLERHEIGEVVVADDTIEGAYAHPRNGKTRFVTQRVDPELARDLAPSGVKFSATRSGRILPTLLAWLLPILPFVILWMWIGRKLGQTGAGGSLVSIGKSRAKVYVEDHTRTSFADVAGVDEAKAELAEVVTFLEDPTSAGRLGARLPKGVLLIGPPGTGKTLLARAVAGEAGVPFFSINGSEFVEMFVGVGAARVRDLFEQAREKAPCIVFIDELDALGRSRNANPLASHDEKEQTLNQLLVELDGFDPKSGIILLGATNRPEILDPALLRAGRFDRQVLVDRPEKRGRVEILRVHVKKVKISESVSLEEIAALTPGFTGADLANLTNEAALAATRRGAELVEMQDFNNAIERIVAGLERKNRILNPRERAVIAHHEMGHTLVAASLPGTDVVHKVSIIPRGIGALGYTIQRPTDDRYLMTRRELEDKLAVLLGGRAAERLVFHHLSTGAADDLSRATNIARSMVTRYGMVSELGNATYEEEPTSFLGGPSLPGSVVRQYSESTAREIDCAVRTIVDSAFERAMEILAHHRDVLEDAAKTLLEVETLDATGLAPFFARLAQDPAEERSEESQLELPSVH